MDRKEELRKVLGSQTNDKAVHAQAILGVIADAESRDEKIELLEYTITNLGKVEKHEQILSNKGLDAGRWNDLDSKLTVIVHNQVRNSFFSTKNSKEFATELLRLLEFFSAPDEQTFCLGTVLYTTSVVPYHNLPGDPVTLTGDEYKQLILANKDKSELMRYLVELPFFDWTQAASQVLQVIDDCGDNKKLRIALLSLFMMAKTDIERKKD